MATTGFRQRMTTICRSSAEPSFTSASSGGTAHAKPRLVAVALFYVAVIAVLALRPQGLFGEPVGRRA